VKRKKEENRSVIYITGLATPLGFISNCFEVCDETMEKKVENSFSHCIKEWDCRYGESDGALCVISPGIIL
jgi:hypothetical protein